MPSGPGHVLIGRPKCRCACRNGKPPISPGRAAKKPETGTTRCKIACKASAFAAGPARQLAQPFRSGTWTAWPNKQTCWPEKSTRSSGGTGFSAVGQVRHLCPGRVPCVVVGVGGYKFYESRQAQANEAASTRYIIGLRDFAMNKPGEAQKALEDLAANAPTGYATLSRLRFAGYDQGAGNIAEAMSAYEDIAKDGSVDPILANYAQLQIAMLKLDSASFTELKIGSRPCSREKSVAFQRPGAVGYGRLQSRLDRRGA